AVILQACLPRPGGAAVVATPTAGDESAALPAAARTPRSTATPAPSSTPSPDPLGKNIAQAEAAVRAYFNAVSAGDLQTAVGWVSSFSLMIHHMTPADATSELLAWKIAGEAWSDFEILETTSLNEQTMLVRVSYTVSGEENEGAHQVKEAVWPVRLEAGQWRYNWNNLIDVRRLVATAQTVNEITLLPREMKRYSDRIVLDLLVQNRSTGLVVFGQANETLGTFYFGNQAVVAEQTRWVLNPLRAAPSTTLEIRGLFETYPDRVAIRSWDQHNVDPWYVFDLQ
ncbi:MAG TPA: hypothetical protein VLH85_01185, partial [Levilinea sp.]|nr:hypothetical protein [Levilinea sp.]